LLSKRQIKIFIDAIMLGDGCIRYGGRNKKSISRNYYTISKRLADDFQELILKIGFSGHIQSRIPITKGIGNRLFKKVNRIYNVHWIVKNNICKVIKKHYYKQYYNGNVYCVDVPNHIIYVRRNGIPVWCGNSVTLNKAGMYVCLPARTSILASANPIHGNYDLTQSIAKQIDLPSPLLNRFDLIFVLLDKPDKDFDEKAVEHIFKSYKEKILPKIKPDLFKKYINYCRKLKPELNDDILDYLQKFYTSLRQRSTKDGKKGLPINLRNMEALIRLSEANAKLRLSERVEIEDVLVAREIFIFSLKQIGIDTETGVIDMSRIGEKVPISKRGKMETIRGMVLGMPKDDNGEISYYKILELAKESGISTMDVDDCLYELNRIGEIINPSSGKYKVVR
jgi:replicative DNA helicase Mcm